MSTTMVDAAGAGLAVHRDRAGGVVELAAPRGDAHVVGLEARVGVRRVDVVGDRRGLGGGGGEQGGGGEAGQGVHRKFSGGLSGWRATSWRGSPSSTTNESRAFRHARPHWIASIAADVDAFARDESPCWPRRATLTRKRRPCSSPCSSSSSPSPPCSPTPARGRTRSASSAPSASPRPCVQVAEQIDDFHEWQQWSPWEHIDPTMQRTLQRRRRRRRRGLRMDSTGKAGAGRMEITEMRAGAGARPDRDQARLLQALEGEQHGRVPDDAHRRRHRPHLGDVRARARSCPS